MSDSNIKLGDKLIVGKEAFINLGVQPMFFVYAGVVIQCLLLSVIIGSIIKKIEEKSKNAEVRLAIKLKEMDTRWDYDDPQYSIGIPESFSIDQCKHSLFGASKVAADVMVQEYGRYFGMATCCLRGGCLTGPSHSGVELHGFLSYLVKCNLESKTYKIFGYKGKQVRDNIHSEDVAQFIDLFIKLRPRNTTLMINKCIWY